MRLTTFNVLHGRSPTDDRVDLDRFAAAVGGLHADVLALQEVDHDQPRSHGADLTAVAAKACGAVAHCFAPALSGLPGAWEAVSGAEPAGTPLYGVALVSRYPVLGWDVVRLPALPGQVPVLFPGRRRPVVVTDEPRVALVGHIDGPTGPVTVVSTHLSFIPLWNVVQLRHLLSRLRQASPLVLMGDLNMGPARAGLVTGLRSLACAATFPAHAPGKQIDHILSRGLSSVPSGGHAPATPVSDHRPLTVTLTAAVAPRRPSSG